MKQVFKSALSVVAGVAAMVGVAAVPAMVSAYSDNTEGGSRPSYTKSQITKADWAEDKIVFNSISDSIIGDEFNFVGARECPNGYCGGATINTEWKGNDINVEDGKTYIIRLYVHNNNPYGDVNNPYASKGVAENTKVAFSIPGTPSTQIKVRGVLTSSNASPSEYTDYVNFNANQAFHLEYVKGSATWENNKIGLGGVQLSDDIVEAKNGGVLVGYEALDGRIPGCYDFDGTATIEVKAVYDTEFTVVNKVRLVGDADKSWKNSVEAKIGDQVEFQAQYKNRSSERHAGVVMRHILPNNAEYVSGSTKLYNSVYPNGGTLLIDDVVNPDKGVNIGNYGGYTDITKDDGANAYVRITATIVDNNLACGHNTLADWAQAQAGAKDQKVLQDYATVSVVKVCEDEPTPDDPEPTPDPIDKLPTAGPSAIAGGVIATGSIVTAAGYYIASRRSLR